MKVIVATSIELTPGGGKANKAILTVPGTFVFAKIRYPTAVAELRSILATDRMEASYISSNWSPLTSSVSWALTFMTTCCPASPAASARPVVESVIVKVIVLWLDGPACATRAAISVPVIISTSVIVIVAIFFMFTPCVYLVRRESVC